MPRTQSASKRATTAKSKNSRVIAGSRRLPLSSFRTKLLIGLGIVLLGAGTYAGYAIWYSQTVGASSCVDKQYSYGNKSTCVKYVQKILNVADINVSLKVTGTFDSLTKKAVVTFQKGMELTGSGVVDLTTWQQLCTIAGSSDEETYTLAGCEGLEVDARAQNNLSFTINTSDESDDSTPSQSSNSSWFSLVSMPDTQSEVIRDVKSGVSPRDLVDKDMKWIVNNRNDRNIQVVVGPGDLTHAAALGSNASVNTKIKKMWASISGSYKILDNAGIPYSITNGNHDTAAVSLSTKANSYGARSVLHNQAALFRDTSLLNKTFPVTRAGMNGLTLKDSNRIENSYRTFRVKNTNWLVLAMEYSPRREVVDWAKSVVSSHPSYNVVIVTHQYMQSGGTKLYTSCNASDCVTTQQLHDELVMRYPNVKILFSGHTIVEATLEETSSAGNKVVQYKTTMHACMGDEPCRNPIRIVKVDLVNNTVTSQLCRNVTATSVKNCTTQTTAGMQFVASDNTSSR